MMVAPVRRPPQGGARLHATRCLNCRRECVIPHNQSFCSKPCKAEFNRRRGGATREPKEWPAHELEQMLDAAVRQETVPRHLREENVVTKPSKGSVVLRGSDGREAKASIEQLEKALDRVGDDIADTVVGNARTRKARERAQSMLDEVAGMGPGIWWPTNLRPHLVAAKQRAKEDLRAEHGVQFRREGGDCIVEAFNHIATVRIVLPGEGKHAPDRAVVPKKAMKLLADAEDEQAKLWFAGPSVVILVDEAIHKFKLIPPDLPFPESGLHTLPLGRMINGVTCDATALANIQRALGCDVVSLRNCKKGTAAVVPYETGTTYNRGYLSLWSDVEREEG